MKAAKPESTAGVFVSTLSAMHNGKVLEDLDDTIRDVTRSVQSVGKKGELTLKLVITPNGVGAGDVALFRVEEDIKVKLPKKGRSPSVFFADDDANLTRRNPKQEEIVFTAVDGGKSAGPQGVAKAAAQSAS